MSARYPRGGAPIAVAGLLIAAQIIVFLIWLAAPNVMGV